VLRRRAPEGAQRPLIVTGSGATRSAGRWGAPVVAHRSGSRRGRGVLAEGAAGRRRTPLSLRPGLPGGSWAKGLTYEW